MHRRPVRQTCAPPGQTTRPTRPARQLSTALGGCAPMQRDRTILRRHLGPGDNPTFKQREPARIDRPPTRRRRSTVPSCPAHRDYPARSPCRATRPDDPTLPAHCDNPTPHARTLAASALRRAVSGRLTSRLTGPNCTTLAVPTSHTGPLAHDDPLRAQTTLPAARNPSGCPARTADLSSLPDQCSPARLASSQLRPEPRPHPPPPDLPDLCSSHRHPTSQLLPPTCLAAPGTHD